jgi:hypothetical protein
MTMLSRRDIVAGVLVGAALAVPGVRMPPPQRKSVAIEPIGDGLVIADGWVLREREASAVFA